MIFCEKKKTKVALFFSSLGIFCQKFEQKKPPVNFQVAEIPLHRTQSCAERWTPNRFLLSHLAKLREPNDNEPFETPGGFLLVRKFSTPWRIHGTDIIYLHEWLIF